MKTIILYEPQTLEQFTGLFAGYSLKEIETALMKLSPQDIDKLAQGVLNLWFAEDAPQTAVWQ